MPRLMIRDASEDDIAVIYSLVAELAEFEQLSEELESTEEDFRQALFGENPVARVSLALSDDVVRDRGGDRGGEGVADRGADRGDDGKVVAMALWFPTFSTFAGRAGIWLEDLYVRPAHRGRGHGRALLEHLRAMSEGRVEWSVLDWNERAIAFYRNIGARPLDGWTTYRWDAPSPVTGHQGRALDTPNDRL